MVEFLKDFGTGLAAMACTALAIGGAYYWIFDNFPRIDFPVWLGIGCLFFGLVAWIYYVGRFLRGK